MRQRIYVAGPISIGDRQKNVQQALEAGQKLVEMGYAPFIPHLTCFWEDGGYKPGYETWFDMVSAYIEACIAIVRLSGESPGADREVILAREIGIPVYYSLEELQAYPPEPVEEHPGFTAVIEEIKEMRRKKGRDYGNDQDNFANIRAAEKFGVPAWMGAILRANDKMTRIQTFSKKGKLENEPIEDSLLDMATYCMIALVLWREACSPTA